MLFIADGVDDEAIKKSTYLKKDKAFSGFVFYYTLNGGFIIGEKVKDDKRIAYATKARPYSNKKVEELKEDVEQQYNCYTTTIQQGYQDCYYDSQTNELLWCDDEVWVTIEEYTWCVFTTDGGDNGPVNPNPCGRNGISNSGPITIQVANPNDPDNPILYPCNENPPAPINRDTINNLNNPDADCILKG